MWGTPQGSRKTVTEWSRPGSFRVPLVTESADRARCSRVCLSAEGRREAEARGLPLVKWVAGNARPTRARRPTAIFQKCRGCIACEVSSPLCCDSCRSLSQPKSRSLRRLGVPRSAYPESWMGKANRDSKRIPVPHIFKPLDALQLPNELQPVLNLPPRGLRRVELAETSNEHVEVGDRRREVGVIKDIEELGSELHVEGFRDFGDLGVFHHGVIQVDQPWPD